MRVACVGYIHGSGGAERQIIMLANALSEMGHETYLLAVAAFNVKYDISDKVKVRDLSPVEKRTGNKILLRYQALREAMEEIKPEVSVHFWLQSVYLSALMPKSVCGRIIYSERGDPGDKEYDGLLGTVRALAFQRVNGFVFQSKGAQNHFGQKIQNRSIVIPNPVLVQRSDYPVITQRRHAVVNVGRLHEQKNQKLLINAFARISKDHPDVMLEIYGAGALKEELQNQIDELGLCGRVLLMGTTREIHQRIYDAALFVLSSDYEGMPNALLEAATLGLPCISADCRPGGAREIIHNGEDGIIVPVGNCDALSAAMDDLLSHPDKAEVMGQNAMIHSEKFRPEAIYTRWENFLEEVIR